MNLLIIEWPAFYRRSDITAQPRCARHGRELLVGIDRHRPRHALEQGRDRCASRCTGSIRRSRRAACRAADSHASRRLTLPSRKHGMPATLPVKRPLRCSGSVAIRCSTPNSRAIGAVTKLLVAVMIAHRSPAARCLRTSSRAGAPIIGRMRAAMKSRVPALEVGRLVRGERAQREAEELVDVERAGDVLVVVGAVLRLVALALEHAAVDEELAPLVVAVAGEERVVEVEQGQPHGPRV